MGLYPSGQQQITNPTGSEQIPADGGGAESAYINSGAIAALAFQGQVSYQTVAATGSTQANAAALKPGLNLVTAADGTKGVTLPAAPAVGTIVVVKNNSGSALLVWPDPAATINAIGSHSDLSFAANTCALLWASSATQWWSLPLLPS